MKSITNAYVVNTTTTKKRNPAQRTVSTVDTCVT
jgi:hypothetical protein